MRCPGSAWFSSFHSYNPVRISRVRWWQSDHFITFGTTAFTLAMQTKRTSSRSDILFFWRVMSEFLFHPHLFAAIYNYRPGFLRHRRMLRDNLGLEKVCASFSNIIVCCVISPHLFRRLCFGFFIEVGDFLVMGTFFKVRRKIDFLRYGAFLAIKRLWTKCCVLPQYDFLWASLEYWCNFCASFVKLLALFIFSICWRIRLEVSQNKYDQYIFKVSLI